MKHERAGRGRVCPPTSSRRASLRWAQRSAASRGRERPEEPCTLRTPYQRDRDRIVHSKSFRRLKHKTQVFIAPEGDHYRTRLTHTLEVSGIARTVARALRLNEDLTEAIALGHDLGHTPFGHAGEEVMRRDAASSWARAASSTTSRASGWSRCWRTTAAASTSPGRCGTASATTPASEQPATLEGQIVHFADRIAYINHDIDDALRAGLITPADLPPGPVALLGETGSERIDALVHDLVDTSDEHRDHRPDAGRSARPWTSCATFLFQTVYPRSLAAGRRAEGAATLDHQPDGSTSSSIPRSCRRPPDRRGRRVTPTGRELVRAVTDHVAGMTDRYAQRLYLELFVPRCWRPVRRRSHRELSEPDRPSRVSRGAAASAGPREPLHQGRAACRRCSRRPTSST